MKLDSPHAPVRGVCDPYQVLLDVRAVLALLVGATREVQS